ncbi:MAG: hypothetical protein RLP44_23035 [Aggregatilineales bacterium]
MSSHKNEIYSFIIRKKPTGTRRIWHLASGIWHLASGIWHLASGIWHLASGIWHRSSSVGIGLAIAEALAQEGVNLLLCARNEERVITEAQTISNKPLPSLVFQRCGMFTYSRFRVGYCWHGLCDAFYRLCDALRRCRIMAIDQTPDQHQDRCNRVEAM